MCSARRNVRFTPKADIVTVSSRPRVRTELFPSASLTATPACSNPRIVKVYGVGPTSPAWDSNTPWQRAHHSYCRTAHLRTDSAVMSYQSRPIKIEPQAGNRCFDPRVVDVPGVDVAEPGGDGLPRARAKRLRRCARLVRHLPVGVEGREVQRDVGPSSITHRLSASISAGESFSPGISRVVISNQTSVSCLRYSSGLEHGRELAGAEALVEALGEAFEVDVGGVHVPEEFDPRLCAM